MMGARPIIVREARNPGLTLVHPAARRSQITQNQLISQLARFSLHPRT